VLSARQKIVFQQLADQGFEVVVIRSKEEVDSFVDTI
jgi:ABC-type hemin transport system substrate-binding protein